MRRSVWTGLGLTAVLCTVLLSACSESPTEPSTPTNPPIPAPTFKAAKGPNGESRYLVQFKTAESSDFESKVKALGGKVYRRSGEIGATLVTGLSAQAATTLRGRSDVEDVSSDLVAQWIPPRNRLMRSVVGVTGKRIEQGSGINQSGAFFFNDFQWNMRVIRAPEGWAQTPAGNHTLVCLLDTGIDPNHIDLAGKVDLNLSTSFVETEPFIEDLHFHGTFTAALVSSNGLGIASVAPAARLCEIKVLDQAGNGNFADIIAGIVYGGVIRADVINLSLGALLDLSDKDQRGLAKAIQKAVDFAHRQGVTVVAGSGNDALNLDQTGKVQFIPAQLDHVISVGATGPLNQQNFDRLASYSNFGRSGNDVVAPGGEFIEGVTLDQFLFQDLIISACSEFVPGCEGGVFYTFADGTSAAAPHVSGAAAVIESSRLGDQSPNRIEECIDRGADDIGPRVFFGAGRIDIPAEAACSPAS
jgi:subtilisin family serine protease